MDVERLDDVAKVRHIALSRWRSKSSSLPTILFCECGWVAIRRLARPQAFSGHAHSRASALQKFPPGDARSRGRRCQYHIRYSSQVPLALPLAGPPLLRSGSNQGAGETPRRSGLVGVRIKSPRGDLELLLQLIQLRLQLRIAVGHGCNGSTAGQFASRSGVKGRSLVSDRGSAAWWR